MSGEIVWKGGLSQWSKIVERERRMLLSSEVLTLAKKLDKQLYEGKALDYFLNPSQQARLIDNRRLQFGFFHVWARGNNKYSVFYDHKDFEDFLNCCGKMAERYRTVITAFVLMDNHFHLQVYTNNLTPFMSAFLKSFNQRYNRRKGTFGSVFFPPFCSSPLLTLPALESNLLYILANPVRAGICTDSAEYRWSSIHNFYTANEQNSELEAYLPVNTLVSKTLYHSTENFKSALKDYIKKPWSIWSKREEERNSLNTMERRELKQLEGGKAAEGETASENSANDRAAEGETTLQKSADIELRRLNTGNRGHRPSDTKRGGLITPTDAEVNQFAISAITQNKWDQIPIEELNTIILFLRRELGASARQIAAALKIPQSEIVRTLRQN